LLLVDTIINNMSGRYGKYGEIKRMARLRKHIASLPLRKDGGKHALKKPNLTKRRTPLQH